MAGSISGPAAGSFALSRKPADPWTVEFMMGI